MVYVDKLHQWIAKDKIAHIVGARFNHMWCHMWADTAKELHTMAESMGLKFKWAHQANDGFWHYDLVPTKRKIAIDKGAIETDIITWRNEQKEKVEGETE